MTRSKEIIKLIFEELEDILLTLYRKRTNTTTERYAFHCLRKKPGQPVKELVKQLIQASICKFDAFVMEA